MFATASTQIPATALILRSKLISSNAILSRT
jgi:hypothetical protein